MSTRTDPAIPIRLGAMVLLAVVVATPSNSQEDEEELEAERLLAKAMRACKAVNFRAADAAWKKVIDDFPDTFAAYEARERLEPNALLYVRPLEVNGPPERRIDVFVLAEGYQRKDQKAFLTQAELTARLFFQVKVFERYRGYFNFHAMHIASREEGVDVGEKQFDTALGAHQTAYSQGQVAVDRAAVRRYLDEDPRSEGLAIVVVRRGTLGTGGGGVAVVGGGAGNTVVHEWGHAFGMLLDEYTSDVGYRGGTPTGFNISDTDDPARVPWRHFLEADVNGVGVFPGGAGRSKGAWRPTARACAMASGASFCVVCREALVASIYGLVGPLDEAQPEPGWVELEDDAPPRFRVFPMPMSEKPALTVEFSLQRIAVTGAPSRGDSERAASSEGGPSRASIFDRASRRRPRWNLPEPGPLPGEAVEARRVRTEDRRIAFEPVLADLEPGDYRLHARVIDPVDWVLKTEWRNCMVETVDWDFTIPSVDEHR